ncbi:MAG: 4'-phosphopantetheinyl transferase superfamily protein [Clostridia bacterium]|nr:4'-phosphopantetheinyl transferase superfamily protein [Clostridia bacterium]
MIAVYAVDCTPLLNDDAIVSALPRLDEKRRSRVRRLRVPLKRAQCVAAGLLLTHLFGCDDVPPALTYGENGKPYLADSSGPHFSISHTDVWVFCAVSGHEIGLDAQTRRRVCPRLAARSLSPEELSWARQDIELHFARLWTMKEAYLKYTGTGLSVPIRSVTVSVPPTEGRDGKHDLFWHYPYFSDPNIAITVCGREDTCSPVHVLRIEDL